MRPWSKFKVALKCPIVSWLDRAFADDEGQCARVLRERLPSPQQLQGCNVPYKLILEVRRLRRETITGADAKRAYHLNNADLVHLVTVQVSSPKHYSLIEVFRGYCERDFSQPCLLTLMLQGATLPLKSKLKHNQ